MEIVREVLKYYPLSWPKAPQALARAKSLLEIPFSARNRYLSAADSQGEFANGKCRIKGRTTPRDSPDHGPYARYAILPVTVCRLAWWVRREITIQIAEVCASWADIRSGFANILRKLLEHGDNEMTRFFEVLPAKKVGEPRSSNGSVKAA
jgi:hypothetical protein